MHLADCHRDVVPAEYYAMLFYSSCKRIIYARSECMLRSLTSIGEADVSGFSERWQILAGNYSERSIVKRRNRKGDQKRECASGRLHFAR